MRFTINLATRTYLDRELNRILLISVLFLTALAGWKFFGFCGNMGQLERIRSDIASLEERLRSRPAGVSEQDFKRQQQSIRFYNDIIERKSSDWITLLDQLEQTTPEGIALASLVPDRKTGALKIEGRARNFGQIRSYLERLDDSRLFRDVLLMSHGEVAVGTKGRGLHFIISCRTVKP